jgi:putative membrane protein
VTLTPWQPHLEVWLLVAGIAGSYWYAIRRIGPHVVHEGEPIVTGSQLRWFCSGLVVLWLASDWPVHDIAEEHLYFVHMIQHLLLSLLMPALFLLGTPRWLARLLIGDGAAYQCLRRLTRPIVATLLFNGVVVLTHAPAVVNASVESGLLHYGLHVLLVFSALVMWMPVCGPFPELRLSAPAQMLYLFVQSIVPTVPAAWLTFADGVVYDAYDHLPRLWGVSVATDQQTAGLIMKVVGGFYLWSIITVLFFRWAAREAQPELAGAALTYDEVEREFERLGPPPKSEDRPDLPT